MVRGRSMDKTLPPSRSLTVQRHYRARKADRLRELENAVQDLSQENIALKAELAKLKEEKEAGTCKCGDRVSDVRSHLEKALGHLEEIGRRSHIGQDKVYNATPFNQVPAFPIAHSISNPTTTRIRPASPTPCCNGLTTCDLPVPSPKEDTRVHPTSSAREEQIDNTLDTQRQTGDSVQTVSQDLTLDPSQCCYGLVICPDDDEEVQVQV
ncbi:hypothetical protein IAU59_005510 [Kwoniella sp. CBS 9459]